MENTKLFCPFCGEAIEVCVYDDEGNYRGPLGCSYESNPWSGLSYGLRHHNPGECLLCYCGDGELVGGWMFDAPEQAVEALLKRTGAKPYSPQKMRIKLPGGQTLVVEQSNDPDFQREIFVGIEDEKGQYIQDLAVIRSEYSFDEQDNVVWSDDKFCVFVYGNADSEDYSEGFGIPLRKV